jgi:hypothetical protein
LIRAESPTTTMPELPFPEAVDDAIEALSPVA